MLRKLTIALTASLMIVPACAAGEDVELKDISFGFEGPFGTFDRAQLQRGFQVYTEVCAACHGLRLLAYRNLGEPGGPFDVPGVSPSVIDAQVKMIAAQALVPDLDAEGQPTTRPGIPADRFVSPFPNERAARAANNGAAPPDLSVIIKARAHGPQYTYSLLMGYIDPPQDFRLQTGMSYNAAFPGHQIAMPQPLSDGQVSYADGTTASVDQMAQDVVAFLAWAAEPKAEERKRLGFKVTIFLIVLAGLLYLSYRRVWRDIEH